MRIVNQLPHALTTVKTCHTSDVKIVLSYYCTDAPVIR
jgi:hypothetical protein